MLKFFSKKGLVILGALLTMSSLNAWEECCDTSGDTGCNRFYVGAFGGGLYSTSTRTTQLGTALFSEASGGPLAVDARGHLKKTSTGFGGVQMGYEWKQCAAPLCSTGWTLSPGLEIEAFWYGHSRKGSLYNTTDTERLPEHDFHDSFHTNSGVYLANATFTFNNSWEISPYLGLGVGATRISLSNAKSLQVAPPEPGINHFNTHKSDASWAFAAQVKVGLRYKICESLHFFGEYRWLYVDFSNYILGSTLYPTHAHTTPWNVKIHNIHYNAFAFGIQYDL